jgi:hypothetical protein
VIRRVVAAAATVLAVAALVACSKSSTPSEPAPAAPPSPPAITALPPGHDTPQDTTVKEGPRIIPAESFIRTYLMLFGGLSPLATQTALQGKDGPQLFDTWDDYLGTLGMPDYRFDTPRIARTHALMIATFERVGVALCDRALEHDRTQTPRVVFDFDIPQNLAQADFASRFDVLHRTFLNYPAQLAPTDRVNRFWQLYQDNVKLHASQTGSRFTAAEAGWASICYGLVRHPEFHLY